MAKQLMVTLATVAAAAWVASMTGCAHQGEDQAGGGERPSTGLFAHAHKTGGQIWAENCNRCHIPRPSTQYSAQQWDLITTHMRLRCNLNGEEQRAVYAFMTGK